MTGSLKTQCHMDWLQRLQLVANFNKYQVHTTLETVAIIMTGAFETTCVSCNYVFVPPRNWFFCWLKYQKPWKQSNACNHCFAFNLKPQSQKKPFAMIEWCFPIKTPIKQRNTNFRRQNCFEFPVNVVGWKKVNAQIASIMKVRKHRRLVWTKNVDGCLTGWLSIT